MKTTPAIHRFAISAAAVALFALLPMSAAGQQTGAATGTVYDADGQPLSGIKVSIEGKRRSAKTSKDGTFRLDRLEPGEVLVRFDGAGYVAVVEKVVIDAGWTTGVEIVMTPMVAMLDALVVEAGLGRIDGEVASRSSRISGDASEGDTFSKLGRVPGIQIMRPNGSVGSGGRILMRGINSVALSNNPVIYVDGIRVSGSQPSFGQESRGPIGQGAYNLDFVDPRDIDRIEIVRGPATAVRYGLDASSGVILIYTKRGGRS
jgi:TonB-dependent starch-binding outer membrane protein SusC